MRVKRAGALFVYPVVIVGLVILVCVTIMAMLALQQSQRLHAEQIAGDFHLGSSFCAAQAHEEVDSMERTLRDRLGDRTPGSETALRLARRSQHLLDARILELDQLQERFADERFAAPCAACSMRTIGSGPNFSRPTRSCRRLSRCSCAASSVSASVWTSSRPCMPTSTWR
ncbi:MAG: hypothetical protein GY715_04695 [Planctomycetes bacterium]|nr:hypothetical protein [Planctomycetota bacterium]